MSFTCSGCGETHPHDPKLKIKGALVCLDGEWHQVDEALLCTDCSPFGTEARR